MRRLSGRISLDPPSPGHGLGPVPVTGFPQEHADELRRLAGRGGGLLRGNDLAAVLLQVLSEVHDATVNPASRRPGFMTARRSFSPQLPVSRPGTAAGSAGYLSGTSRPVPPACGPARCDRMLP